MYFNMNVISISYLDKIIVSTHSSSNIEPPIGLFTAQERPAWANARAKLIELGNEAILEKIQSALMIVVLDSASPADNDEVVIFDC